tara:strand:+ start:247 stop:456 length:210 start_codon:yes stop_codon:yes gene_type:complete
METLKKQYQKRTRKLIEGLRKNINNPAWVNSQEYFNLKTDLRFVYKQIDILEQKERLGEEEYNKQLNSF